MGGKKLKITLEPFAYPRNFVVETVGQYLPFASLTACSLSWYNCGAHLFTYGDEAGARGGQSGDRSAPASANLQRRVPDSIAL